MWNLKIQKDIIDGRLVAKKSYFDGNVFYKSKKWKVLKKFSQYKLYAIIKNALK